MQLQGVNSLSDIQSSGNYYLTSDITVPSTFSTITSFSGYLNGNHHTISGLSHPLFDELSGTVCNLTLSGVSINGDQEYLGAIACTANGQARVYNCGIIDDASSIASTHGTAYVGSLVGQINGNARVVNCYSFANVSGAYASGIVGKNNGSYTTTPATVLANNVNKATGVTTMVTNCMFYGNATGTIQNSPIYGGTLINNRHVPIYNFYAYGKYEENATTEYNGALPAEEDYLTKIEFFRLALNNNRELNAWYLTGDNRHALLLDKWVLDKSKAPYPILKPWGYYPSLVNLYPSREYAITAEGVPLDEIESDNLQSPTNKYCGKTLGRLEVTVKWGLGGLSPHDTDEEATIYLPILDMDTLNHDFNYYKVQLPFYNDFWDDNYRSSTSNDPYGRVVTGWKITNIAGDNGKNTGTYSTTGNNAYNFADRNCWGKDLYGTSGRVFAQGGYYNVPEGVTGITIEAYWGRAVYLNQRTEMVFYPKVNNFNVNNPNQFYDDDSTVFRMPFKMMPAYASPLQPAFTDFVAAVNALPVAGDLNNGHAPNTVYDAAVVLLSNYSNHRFTYPCGSSSAEDHPHTIMSIDRDNDHEPDYGLCFYWRTRDPMAPVRFDFVNNPSFGLLKKPADHKLTTRLGIPHPRGHFEITETSNGFYNQNEYADCSPSNCRIGNDLSGCCTRDAFAPMILNGGSTNMVNGTFDNGYNKAIEYIILGGNFYATLWTPGCQEWALESQSYYHSPTTLLGAEIQEYYNTGRNAALTNDEQENAYTYANGGRIGTYAGSYLEQLNGSLFTRLDHVIIDTFYGGSTSAAKPIVGDITNQLSHCIVRYYCGGPKFGDMPNGTTLTNNADHCIFGTYFGAGYGGTALSGQWLVNKSDREIGLIFPVGTINEYFNGTTEDDNDNTRLGYNKAHGGYRVSYHYDWFLFSHAHNTSSCWGTFYNATLSVAQVNSVNTTLTDCWVKGEFYGGGSLGRVSDTATSTLTRCLVEGDAYGGGYSATVPPVSVFNETVSSTPVFNPKTGMFGQLTYPDAQIYHWVQKSETEMPFVDDSEFKKLLGTTVDFSTLGQAGNTVITLDNTEVRGNLFGGGNASTVSGDTHVSILGNGSFIHLNVYGGGNEADVGGSTNVTIGE